MTSNSTSQMTFEIYTDGSSLGNPGKGGWASLIIKINNETKEKFCIELAGFEENTTNNKMEMMSVLKAIDFIGKDLKNKITIFSDSAYVVNGVKSWLPGWIHRDWVTSTGEAVKNRDLWEQFQEFCAFYGSSLKFEKIAAHSGHIENERCDFIARSVANDQDIKISLKKTWTKFDDYYSDLKSGLITVSKGSKSSSSKRKRALCYVSLVDGDVYVDTEWSDCQKRMKGHKGCLFKKVMTECERDTVQAEYIGRISEELNNKFSQCC